MKVVILCGGLGTRLREETEFRPKPMVDIGERPILWHIMKHYAHYKYRNFILCLGYKGEKIKKYFLNYQVMHNDFTANLGQNMAVICHGDHEERDYQVTLVDTGQETMTGGRVKRVEKYIDSDLLMVTYGDGVADIDIQALVKFHNSHGKLVTLTTVKPVSRFGVLNLDPGGQVKNFVEKPQLDGWVNAGYYVMSSKIFNYLVGDDCVLEKEPLERLAREGQLMAYRHEGCFFAMDTYREYKYLNELWSSGKAPWRIWEK